MNTNSPAILRSKPAVAVAIGATAAVVAFWIWSPEQGEANLIVTATMLAFVVELLTGRGVLAGMACGAAFIVVAVLYFIPPDPSGLGPPEFVIPIQLTAAAIPMVIASKLGARLRNRLQHNMR